MKVPFTVGSVLVTLQIFINSALQNNVSESYTATDVFNGTTPDSLDRNLQIDVTHSSVTEHVVNGSLGISDTIKSGVLNGIAEHGINGTTSGIPDFMESLVLNDEITESSVKEGDINRTSSEIPDFVKNGDIAAILHFHKHGEIDLPTIHLPDHLNPEFLELVKNGNMPPFSDFVKDRNSNLFENSPPIPDFVMKAMKDGKFPAIPDFVKKSMKDRNTIPAIPDFVKKAMKDGNTSSFPDFMKRENAPAIPDFVKKAMKGGNTSSNPDFMKRGNPPAIPDFVKKAMEDGNTSSIPHFMKRENAPPIPDFVKKAMKGGNTSSIPDFMNRENPPAIPDFVKKAMEDGNTSSIPDFMKRENVPAIPDFVKKALKDGNTSSIPGFAKRGNIPVIPDFVKKSLQGGKAPAIPDSVKESNVSDHETRSDIPDFTTIQKDTSDIIENDPRIPMSFRRKYQRQLEKEAEQRRDLERQKQLVTPPPVTDPLIIPEFMKPFLHHIDSPNSETF